MIALLALAVFASAVLLDYADTRNTQAVTEGRAHAAARWSVAMYLVGCVGFFSVIQVSPLLAIPEVAGLYVGSLLAVRRNRSGETLACQDPFANTCTVHERCRSDLTLVPSAPRDSSRTDGCASTR